MTPADPTSYDLITLGRVGVDLYPQQADVPLAEVETFTKSLGGTATNVAVAAARHGMRTHIVTAVGDDPFGSYVRTALRTFGVDDSGVATVPGLLTPVVFCEIHPPDHFPLLFYRLPTAPDQHLTPQHLDPSVLGQARMLWITGGALATEPSRGTTLLAAGQRHHSADTVLDLDWRPAFWDNPQEAPAWYAKALEHATVAIGNQDEVHVAVGTRDPDRAADLLLERGVRLAVVKQGPAGVLARTPTEDIRIEPLPVHVVNGLGAGDAFGGALAAGLLAGRPLHEVIETANAAGALVAGRPACADDMPYPEEITELLHRHRTRPAGAPPLAVPPASRTRPGDDRSTRRTPRHLTEIRAADPERVRRAMNSRPRFDPARFGGPLFLLAADHPARGALAAGGNPTAMADRHDLLARCAEALARPGVDGFLGTADLIEDLTLLGALDGKLVLGSMNRGGLPGAAFELDDRFTGYDARGIQDAGLDGGKLLLRLDPQDSATATTLESAAHAVDSLNERGLLALVEPFASRRRDGRVRNELTADAQMWANNIAQGLGRTTARTWLKLPVVPEMERMMSSTTLPTLILGGEGGTDQDRLYATWAEALRIPQVRGLIVGRTLLYPPGDDIAEAVDTAVSLLAR
ncbi:5-dehydro-2-deoxygluconokinase [Kitasatospora sp. NPDC085879]|uniref:5-dehydro-2-deoxygluconokinase n=1 Tax=Kitasatospora sp. NPDC085879 TaxID=3154769 RepID=UPI003412EC77